MAELRINSKTNQTSWGFSDGILFYPFGTTELSKATATLVEMEFKKSGLVMADMDADPQEEWRKI